MVTPSWNYSQNLVLLHVLCVVTCLHRPWTTITDCCVLCSFIIWLCDPLGSVTIATPTCTRNYNYILLFELLMLHSVTIAILIIDYHQMPSLIKQLQWWHPDLACTVVFKVQFRDETMVTPWGDWHHRQCLHCLYGFLYSLYVHVGHTNVGLPL